MTPCRKNLSDTDRCGLSASWCTIWSPLDGWLVTIGGALELVARVCSSIGRESTTLLHSECVEGAWSPTLAVRLKRSCRSQASKERTSVPAEGRVPVRLDDVSDRISQASCSLWYTPTRGQMSILSITCILFTLIYSYLWTNVYSQYHMHLVHCDILLLVDKCLFSISHASCSLWYTPTRGQVPLTYFLQRFTNKWNNDTVMFLGWWSSWCDNCWSTTWWQVRTS